MSLNTCTTEVYLQPGLIQKLRSSPAVVASLRTAVRAVEGVDDLLVGDSLESVAPAAVDRRALFARSHVDGRSGDLTVVYKHYWVDSGTGTSHGTPYGYDTGITLPQADGRMLLEAVTSAARAAHASSLPR